MSTNSSRSVVRQFRIVSRKPGEQHFKFRRFPGCQTTGDQPLAWQRLQQARDRAPSWEFDLAIREIVTIIQVSDWVVEP